MSWYLPFCRKKQGLSQLSLLPNFITFLGVIGAVSLDYISSTPLARRVLNSSWETETETSKVGRNVVLVMCWKQSDPGGKDDSHLCQESKSCSVLLLWGSCIFRITTWRQFVTFMLCKPHSGAQICQTWHFTAAISKLVFFSFFIFLNINRIYLSISDTVLRI